MLHNDWCYPFLKKKIKIKVINICRYIARGYVMMQDFYTGNVPIRTGVLQMAFYCFVCVTTGDLYIPRKGTGAQRTSCKLYSIHD